jgi:hypothetical protein
MYYQPDFPYPTLMLQKPYRIDLPFGEDDNGGTNYLGIAGVQMTCLVDLYCDDEGCIAVD